MIFVTGGAGFIGSNFVLDWLAQSDEPVVNLDALTYAGNLENLASLSGDSRHIFVKGDIGDFDLVARLLAEHQPRAIINFAAESHVDRSIHGPEDFIQTNIVGTFRLLEAVRAYWNGLAGEAKDNFRFLHVSTDEVYGSLGKRRPRLRRNPPLRTQQPVFGEQGRQRPSGACLPSHLRAAGAHHQLLQQLRPLPLPGKAHPAGHPQRARRQAAARSTATASRSATGSTSTDHCSAIRRVLEAGRVGRDLQHRRLEREAQPRRRPYPVHHPRRTQSPQRWQAVQGPDHLRQGPPRPRPPLRHRCQQDRTRTRLEAGRNLRDRHQEDRTVVSRQPGLGSATLPAAPTRTGLASNTEKAYDHPQRHHPRRRRRHPAASGHPVGLQATAADLRQADDLLPADHADAGRHPRHPDHLHPAGHPALRATARRWLALGNQPAIRRPAQPGRPRPGLHHRRRLHRQRQLCPRARRQHLLRPRFPPDSRQRRPAQRRCHRLRLPRA